MKQIYLNVGLVAAALVVIVLVISWLFGLTPLMVIKFVANLAIWLFFSIIFQFAGPFITGFASRYFGINLADEFFSDHEDIPGWIEWVVAIALGLVISGLWIWLTPKFAVLHALSIWPNWEFLRWIPVTGDMIINRWHIVWYFLTSAIGYFVGYIGRDQQ